MYFPYEGHIAPEVAVAFQATGGLHSSFQAAQFDIGGFSSWAEFSVQFDGRVVVEFVSEKRFQPKPLAAVHGQNADVGICFCMNRQFGRILFEVESGLIAIQKKGADRRYGRLVFCIN